MQNEGKLRFLAILEILMTNADKRNPLSTQQIIQILENDYNIPAHRITISKDIEIMQRFGFDVRKIESTSNKYYINRSLAIRDLKLVGAAISTAMFIPKGKAHRLFSLLANYLCSESEKELIGCHIETEGRLHRDVFEIIDIADTINEAISKGRKIKFEYYRYTSDKKKVLTNKGESYIFSPYSIILGRETCYVVGYLEKTEKIVGFKLNRIFEVPTILEEDAVPKSEEFRLEEMQYLRFSGYNARLTDVQLKCDGEVADEIIEKFGKDTTFEASGADSFRINVKVPVGKDFLSWVFAQRGKLKILSPAAVKAEYEAMVRDALSGIV